MMAKAGFAGALAAAFFSVFLLAWQGYQGADADWVFGFLAVFWSLLMMLRLMTLTEPLRLPDLTGYLAQKLLSNLRARQERQREIVLETAFGGSFTLFVAAGLSFAAWQIYCAAFSAQNHVPHGISLMIAAFLSDMQSSSSADGLSRFFDWGQGFLLFLSIAMMGFVLRSHAANVTMVRPALLVIAPYALTGLLVCASLVSAESLTVGATGLAGSGTGAMAYLLSTLPATKSLTLFDILLVENGIVGVALLTLLLFIPLGDLVLSAQRGKTDGLVLGCGVLCGIVLMLTVFAPYTPPLLGTIALASMGLLLAWGAGDLAVQSERLDKHPV